MAIKREINHNRCDAVRMVREHLKLKQQEFREKLGIKENQSTLSAIERYRREPSKNLIYKILAIFPQINPDFLYAIPGAPIERAHFAHRKPEQSQESGERPKTDVSEGPPVSGHKTHRIDPDEVSRLKEIIAEMRGEIRALDRRAREAEERAAAAEARAAADPKTRGNGERNGVHGPVSV